MLLDIRSPVTHNVIFHFLFGISCSFPGIAVSYYFISREYALDIYEKKMEKNSAVAKICFRARQMDACTGSVQIIRIENMCTHCHVTNFAKINPMKCSNKNITDILHSYIALILKMSAIFCSKNISKQFKYDANFQYFLSLFLSLTCSIPIVFRTVSDFLLSFFFVSCTKHVYCMNFPNK